MLFRFILWSIIFYILYHTIVKFIRYFKEAYNSNRPKVNVNGQEKFSRSKYEDVEEAKFREIKTDSQHSHDKR